MCQLNTLCRTQPQQLGHHGRTDTVSTNFKCPLDLPYQYILVDGTIFQKRCLQYGQDTRQLRRVSLHLQFVVPTLPRPPHSCSLDLSRPIYAPLRSSAVRSLLTHERPLLKHARTVRILQHKSLQHFPNRVRHRINRHFKATTIKRCLPDLINVLLITGIGWQVPDRSIYKIQAEHEPVRELLPQFEL